MGYQHNDVFIVRVVDDRRDGDSDTWFVGPYGSTRADHMADELRAAASEALLTRECFVEPLFSDDECLRVSGYTRASQGSLR